MKYAMLMVVILFTGILNAQNPVDYEKINASYYNAKEYEFKGFTADVDASTLHELKDSTKSKEAKAIIDNLSIKLEFDADDPDNADVNIENLEKTDDDYFNQDITLATTEIDNDIKGVFSVWSKFTCIPMLRPDDFDYQISQDSEYTKCSYDNSGMEVEYYIKNSTEVDSLILHLPTSIIRIHPVFEVLATGKKLAKSITYSVHDKVFITINLEYKDFGNIMVPCTANILTKDGEDESGIKIYFNNIKLAD